MGKHRRTAAVAASLAAILLLLAQSPVGAHAGMVSSDPTADAVVDHPVSEITLVFSDQTEPIGDGFVVIESDGKTRAPIGWESPDDRTFVLRFDPPITGGEAGVQWTIRSGDSHALNGGFVFTVEAEEPVAAAPADEPAGSSAEPSSAVDPEPAVEPSAIEPSPASPTEFAAANDPEPAQPTSRPRDQDRSTIESAAVVADLTPPDLDADLNGSSGMRLLGLVGRLAALAGSLVAIGALIFLVQLLRGTQGEGRMVTLIAQRAAVVVVAGAAAESAALVAVRGGSWAAMLSPAEWSAALSSRFGAAIALLLVGAFGVSTGSHFQREPIGSRSSEMIRADMTRAGVLAAGHRSAAVTNHPPLGNADEVAASLTPLLFRWQPTSASSGAVLGVVALLAATVVDGHTLGGPGPLLSTAVTLTHVLAGSVWVGGVMVLLVLLRRRLVANRRIEAVDVAVRYSVLASLSLVAVALAGLILTYTHLDTFSQLWTTGYGRLILAKLSLVAVAASLGALNHFVVIPRLVTRTDDVGLGVVLKRLVSAEIVVLVTVVALTAQLVATGL